MSARKSIDEGCTGSINCDVFGHVVVRRVGSGVQGVHVKLTRGQKLTIWERGRLARIQAAEDLSGNEKVTADDIQKVRAELEKATDYDLVKQIAYRALALLEQTVTS